MNLRSSTMKITKKQKKEIEELEKWLAAELLKLKNKELEIKKRYDAKKIAMVRQHITQLKEQ